MRCPNRSFEVEVTPSQWLHISGIFLATQMKAACKDIFNDPFFFLPGYEDRAERIDRAVEDAYHNRTLDYLVYAGNTALLRGRVSSTLDT